MLASVDLNIEEFTSFERSSSWEFPWLTLKDVEEEIIRNEQKS